MIKKMQQSTSWWGVALVLLGIILIVGGLLLGGTWADVNIEVGAAAGVGGLVLRFKPRLLRQIDEVAVEAATTTAEAVAASKTEELEKRLEQVENIRDVQARALERLDEESEQMITAMTAASYSELEKLLTTAIDRGFFSRRLLVKTSNRRESPLIEIFHQPIELDPYASNSPKIQFSVLTLRHFEDSRREFLSSPGGAFLLDPKDTLEDITRRVVFAYNRVSAPIEDNTLALLVEHLISSFRTMARARQSPVESGSRILGSLIFMINEEWVLTDSGLESTQSDRIFRPNHDYYEQSCVINIANISCPPECNTDLWDEAQFYMLRLDDEISSRI